MTNEVLSKSVTAGDAQVAANGGLFYFNFLIPRYSTGMAYALLPEMPEIWTPQRDYILDRTIRCEVFWSGAVRIAISKMASKSWEVKGEIPLRVKRAQDLFHTANMGRGWVNFVKKHARNYLCTDNGAFVETIRATGADGSKILGFVHLDSFRCRRTGDPDRPVIFTDLKGIEHELKWYQVFDLSDMTEPSLGFYDVGLCAAASAYNKIRWMAYIERFKTEKISGERPLAIDFVTGITEKSVEQVLANHKLQQADKSNLVFGNTITVPVMARSDAIGHVRIDYASLPDGFDYDKELRAALLAYANAIGLDPQELQPLSGQLSGTSTQSQVLDDKQEGKGLAMWFQEIMHLFNQELLDDATTFYFQENDQRDKKAKADTFGAWATGVSGLVDKGVITGQQGTQKLVDEDQLPKEFIPEDLTPGLALDDGEKMPGEDVPTLEGIIQQAQTLPAQLPQSQVVQQKAAKDASKLVDSQVAAARKVYQEIAG